MFGRRLSFHGRPMGEVRSAQQKCVRQKMEDGLILLMLDEARRAQRDYLRALLERLSGRLQDGRTAQIARDYALVLSQVADLQSVGASLLEPAALER